MRLITFQDIELVKEVLENKIAYSTPHSDCDNFKSLIAGMLHVSTVNMEGIVRELLEVKRWFNNSHDICY